MSAEREANWPLFKNAGYSRKEYDQLVEEEYMNTLSVLNLYSGSADTSTMQTENTTGNEPFIDNRNLEEQALAISSKNKKGAQADGKKMISQGREIAKSYLSELEGREEVAQADIFK